MHTHSVFRLLIALFGFMLIETSSAVAPNYIPGQIQAEEKAIEKESESGKGSYMFLAVVVTSLLSAICRSGFNAALVGAIVGGISGAIIYFSFEAFVLGFILGAIVGGITKMLKPLLIGPALR